NFTSFCSLYGTFIFSILLKKSNNTLRKIDFQNLRFKGSNPGPQRPLQESPFSHLRNFD
ncbi:hypothetical protein RYX36_006575, partial [Vicia faba]